MGIADAPKSSMQVSLKARKPYQTQRQNVAEVPKRYLSTERKTALSWPDWYNKTLPGQIMQNGWYDGLKHPITCRSVPRSGWHSKTRCQVFVIGEENHFYSKMSKTAPQNWRTVPCVRIVSRKMRSWNATPCSNKPLPHAVQNHRRWTIRSPFRRRKRANKKKPCVERWHCPQDFLKTNFLLDTY